MPPAPAGVAWLRATVGRFSTDEAHKRRRALSVAILDAIPRQSLRAGGLMHPVALLGREMGVGESVVDLVRDVAQAYQPVPATKPVPTRRSAGWSRSSAAATTNRPRPVSGCSCRRARPPRF